jgi:hypothetical protein
MHGRHADDFHGMAATWYGVVPPIFSGGNGNLAPNRYRTLF